jgi:hypothetical protein
LDSRTGGVLPDANGNLFGMASFAGVKGAGGVFELTPVNGAYKENVLYAFRGQSDGAFPQAGLLEDAKGNLYGMTPDGVKGYGMVFELSPPTTGKNYKETVLYKFQNDNDGGMPLGGPLFGADGTPRHGLDRRWSASGRCLCRNALEIARRRRQGCPCTRRLDFGVRAREAYR